MPRPQIIPNLGLVRSPVSDKDYTVQINRNVRLESKVDNSIYNTSIKTQRYNDCTSHATVALMEYNRKKYYLTDSDSKNDGLTTNQDVFSEKFTYYTTRVGMLEWPANEDSGAYIKDAVASTVRYGVCLESVCPYDNSFISRPSSNAFNNALNYQSTCYVRVKDGNNLDERKQSLEDCKRLLSEKYGLVAGFVCYENIWEDDRGLIPLPSGSVIGGHAVFICGYDDDREAFKFKNSWGNSWGDGGYGYLPYQYLLTGNMWDVWTVIQQEDNNAVIGVFKPATEQLYLAQKVKILDSSRIISQNTEGMRNDISTINSTISNLSSVIASAQRNGNVAQIRSLLNNALTHINVLRTNLNSIPPRINNINRVVTQLTTD